MARPASFTDEQLLAAAREVFLERGAQATTAEVARRAGVAEGTLFYRFKTKEGLFRAALEADLQAPRWLEGLAERAGKGEVEALLCELGEEILAHQRTVIPLLMMSWSNRPEGGAKKKAALVGEPVPVRTVRELSRLLEAEMKAGRLGERDAELGARTFLGSLLHYAFHEAMFQGRGPEQSPKRYVREVVRLLLEGLGPREAPAPRAARKRTSR